MSESAVRVFRLVVEYDGREFEGWQIQSGERFARTVQGVLLKAAESVTCQSARLRGAGRTDAGVHAWGQVASAQLQTDLAPKRLRAALNARLPDDVTILDIEEAPANWDALRAAQAKHYRYQIWNGRVNSPLRATRWHWAKEGLSVDAMRQAAAVFVGHHDFASMQGAGSSVKTTDRTLTHFEVRGEAGGEIVLDVFGEGFLRHMVRNLAGTLIEIGRGRWPIERATEILASCDRRQAGPTAPAKGLALMRVWDDLCGDLPPAISSSPPEARPGAVSVDGSPPVG